MNESKLKNNSWYLHSMQRPMNPKSTEQLRRATDLAKCQQGLMSEAELGCAVMSVALVGGGVASKVELKSQEVVRLSMARQGMGLKSLGWAGWTQLLELEPEIPLYLLLELEPEQETPVCDRDQNWNWRPLCQKLDLELY